MSAQALTVVEAAPTPRTRIPVTDPIPVLDTGRFEQMQRVATVMANSSLIPESLNTTKDEKGEKVYLPLGTVIANCFLIVNQAVGWNMDPFAVAQCASVVHGRVCYEGKLIAAVLDQRAGVTLSYEWNNETGDAFGITVRGTLPSETTPREIKGTVGAWKTTRQGSPWGSQPRLQLAYRGAREWARVHKPAVILGVYSEDELEAATLRQERRPPSPPVLIVENAAQEARKAATPAIENKPTVQAEPAEQKREPEPAKAADPAPAQQRRPPRPPAQAQSVTDGTVDEAAGFPGYRARLEKMLGEAPDEAACERVFDALVTRQMSKLTQEQYEALNKVFDARLREFGPQMVWSD